MRPGGLPVIPRVGVGHMYVYTIEKNLEGFALFKTSNEALPVRVAFCGHFGGVLKKAKKYVSLPCYG